MTRTTSSLGECGKLLADQGKERIQKLLFEAAQERQLDRAKGLGLDFSSLTLHQEEWNLYARVCRSFGYSNLADPFESLASALPYQLVQQCLEQPKGKAILLRSWLGHLDLLPKRAHPLYQPFLGELLRQRSRIEEPPRPITLKAARPVNHPVRRLTGLYHHLRNCSQDGLLKSWLRFLFKAAEIMEAERNPKKKVMALLNELFEPQEPEVLEELLLPSSKASSKSKVKLTGEERQLVVMINAIIPFFLSRARFHGDKALEKALFGLFLILPSEGENHKTERMRNRLLGEHRLRRNLSLHQGLIQIHDDYCQSFEEGCKECRLLDLL